MSYLLDLTWKDDYDYDDDLNNIKECERCGKKTITENIAHMEYSRDLCIKCAKLAYRRGEAI